MSPHHWTMLDYWTILVGIACNLACALLGCFLLLRRMSMLGDAISHAVLPGIALAFLFTGQINGLPIIVGAMALGVLTTFLTQTLHTYGHVPEDSSMGAVFTSLFAAGVILINWAARISRVDLDPGCVLYGLLEFTPLDTVNWFGLEVPRALETLLAVLAGTLVFILLFWKELKVASFDPALATAMGFSATLVHYLLMAMVAGVTVASFEAVGAILVVAMLIVPAACAHLLTDRLVWMLVWASVVAVLSAVLGYRFAMMLETQVAPMMAVVAGGLFVLAVFLAPRHGLLSKVLRNWRLTLRIASEDLVGLLYRREEEWQRHASPAAAVPLDEVRRAVPGWTGWLARRLLARRGRIQILPGNALRLTDAGRLQAEAVVRAHRLWETYLGENLELPLDHLHEPAHRMEHYIGPALESALAEQLGQPQHDPHGRAIPPQRPASSPPESSPAAPQ
jgi:manganese/zinc/iron transport system permease protein